MKIKKKLRIQAFDDEGFQLQDRLVEQDIELYNGPKDVHKGPLKIEVNLWEKDDIAKFKDYLDKLTGLVPLEAPGKHKPQKIKASKIVLEPEQRTELANLIIQSESQDKAIAELRKQGFEFLTFDYINSLGLDTGVNDLHKEKYQWMLKLVKKAKNPLNNKYDPMLCFGFKIVGKKIGTFVIYLNREKHKIAKMSWEDKRKLSFKDTEMIKFPTYMIQEERDKFRSEIYQLRQDTEKKPSKFFNRWAPDVEFKDKTEILKRNNE